MELLVESWPAETRLFAVNVSAQLEEAGISYQDLQGDGWSGRLYEGEVGFMLSDVAIPKSVEPGGIVESVIRAVRAKAPNGKSAGLQVVAVDDVCLAALQAQGFKQMGASQALTGQSVKVMQYNWPSPIPDPDPSFATTCPRCGRAWCAPEMPPPLAICAVCDKS